ncbi:MAG: hypothetical protein EON54_03595 [Alcaligenaceae bacterium]|nr:MAG: hypothetical protein EON54_03595 [Alcaligenaceae bacterium]
MKIVNLSGATSTVTCLMVVALALPGCGGGSDDRSFVVPLPVVDAPAVEAGPKSVTVGTVGRAFTETGGTQLVYLELLKRSGVKVRSVGCYKNPSVRDIGFVNQFSAEELTASAGDGGPLRLYTYEISSADQDAVAKYFLPSIPISEYSLPVPCPFLSDGSSNPVNDEYGALDVPVVSVARAAPIYTASGSTPEIFYRQLTAAGVGVLAVSCSKNSTRRDIPTPDSPGYDPASSDSYTKRLYRYEILKSDLAAAERAGFYTIYSTSAYAIGEYNTMVRCNIQADGSLNSHPDLLGLLDRN